MNRKAVDFSTLNFDLVDLLLWKIKKGHGSKRGTD